MDTTWERALGRYADRIYRLALLRDPGGHRAAQATVSAFRTLDWTAVELDDTIEARLLMALPPVNRTWRKAALPGIRADFWQLPATTRFALGLRLTRGYDTTAIASVLGRTAGEVRRLLVDALAGLAGDHGRVLRDDCRLSRMARLDEHGAERAHVLNCADCQAAIPRWEHVEATLGEEITRATGLLVLPRPAMDELRLALRGGASGDVPIWRRPVLLQMLLIVCVGAAVMALVVPRRSAETGGHVRRSARDLLAQALARYGAPPEGTGVLHRRYAVESERPRTVLTADSWIDAQAPAQHRMQLSIGDQLQEWQAGDGAGRLRYLLIDDQLCSPGYTQEALALRELHVWKMDADAQEEQGAARWRYGVWALGRRYLEVALAADRLRSLGAVAQEENAPSAAVVTLAAEGRAINGTLLLRLDAVSGELREVREVVDDNGVAQSRTPWRLLDEEWITAADAKRAGIFTTVPRDNRPRELLREMPLLDPACPALVDGAVVSLPQQLASVSFGPSFFGLAQVPAETERIFAASQPLSHGTNPSRAVPGWSAMTYISPGKRLVLYGTLNTNLLADGEERAGDWRIHFTAVGRQVLSGVAARAVDGRNSRLPMETFIFYAEGWMRDELLSALGTVRVLKLGDTLDDDPRMFDPVPMPGTVRAIMRSALPVTERPAGQLLHGIYDYQMRKEAVVGTLPDPYHAKPVDGITEFWVAYDVDGLRARYRTIQLFNPKQIRSVEWSVNGERRVYYPGLGVVDNVPAVTGDPMWRLEESVRDVFRFGLFDIAEGPPGTITLRGAVPVAATGLLNVQHSQHQSRSAALYWPWMADLTFDFVTYRRTFDRRSGQLVSAETWADVGGRLTLLERLDVERLETLSDVTGADLNYTPPVGTPVLDVTFSAISSRRTRSSPRLDDVVALSSTPLWGWRDPAIASFASATLSGQEGEPGYWFEQIDNIVETKAAVRLHYLLVSGKEVSLLEGRAPYIRLSLLQTPPEWTESLEHRLRLGGADGTVWLMRDDGERRWAILEIDGLVIVAGYSASVDNAEILALLAKLEPLP